MEELLSLKWNNHRSTFIHIIAGLREKQSYTDVTLACDGKFYSVHKLVLSTCSEYFSAMFDKTPCKNPVIVLKDIKSDDLDALLDYMYLGEVNVRQSDLASLIKAAECLRIKGLAVPDDEPPKKMGPGRAGSSNAPERRTDSPPAKRKRREGSEESREDSRHSSQQPHPAQAQTPPPSSSRPKTPPGGTQRHSPTPHPPRPSQSSPSEGGRAPSPTHPPVVSPAERTTPQSRGGGEGDGFDQSAPFVKVEMDDGGQGDPLGDSYDVPSDGYKEESEVGGDLSNDFPEFLQAAAAGTLPGNASSFTHNYPGTSGFHHDLSGWQGEQPLGGSFSGLNFPHTSQDSSQNAQPGMAEAAVPGCPGAWRPAPASRLLGATAADATATTADAAAAAAAEGGGGGGGGGGWSGVSGGSVEEKVLFVGMMEEEANGGSYQCLQCGKTFHGVRRKRNLERHMMIHRGEKPYSCPFCPHRANQKSNLITHIRLRHIRVHPTTPQQ